MLPLSGKETLREHTYMIDTALEVFAYGYLHHDCRENF